MSYRVIDKLTGKVVETHDSGKNATRAAIILGAHAAKHNFDSHYEVEPPTFYTMDELDLPDWVKEVLKGYGSCEDCHE